MTQKTKPVTKKRLENGALYYLARYESSEEKLRTVLKRRLMRAKMQSVNVPDEAESWIEDIISSVKNAGYLSNERFAENLADKYRRAGKSRKFIQTKLKQAGIDNALTERLLESENASETELCAAQKLVCKKKMGFMRPAEERRIFFKKDLATLARAGFSFDIAVKALNLSAQDEDMEDVCF